jgi:hypothetical protein
VAADFNGDGKPDLAFNSNGVNVMLGNGDGTFRPPVLWIDDPSLSFVAVGDFHGNGAADFITCKTNTPHYPLGDLSYCPYPAAAGDFNGDGKLDLVSTAYDQSSAQDYGWYVNVCLGRGDATFQRCGNLGYSRWFRPVIAVDDFNGDGKTDIAFSVMGAIAVLLGNGDGTFRPGSIGTQGPILFDHFSSLIAGEFNGDGTTDFVSISDVGTRVFLGEVIPPPKVSLTSSLNPSVYGQDVTLTATVTPVDATGSIYFYDDKGSSYSANLVNGQASITTNTLIAGVHALTAFYSGDPKYFSITSPVLTQTVTVAVPSVTLTASLNPASAMQPILLAAAVSAPLATGSVTFKDGGSTIGTGPLISGVAKLFGPTLSPGTHSLTAVYSGDQYDQSVTSAVLIETINEGIAATAVLTASSNPVAYGHGVALTASISPADAAGVVTFYDGVTVLGNQPVIAGRATLATPLLQAGNRSLHALYHGDGAHLASKTNNLSLLVKSLPAAAFQAPANYPLPYPRTLVVADFNGDGIPDFAAADYEDVAIFLGQGDGNFQPPSIVKTGFPAYSLAAGDFNNDGKVDLTYAGSGDVVGVLLGNGDGAFQPPMMYDTGGYANLVVTGDFNGDGITDIIVGYYSPGDAGTGAMRVLFGYGDGTFQPFAYYSDIWNITAVAVEDFNGDGIPDLAVGDARFGLRIFRGKGDGTFSALGSFPLRSMISSIAVGDFTGRGISDIAVTCWDGNVYRLRGIGNGQFDRPSAYSIGPASSYTQMSVVVADFNGDGKLDLIVTNPQGIAILLNNGDGTFQDPMNYPGNYGWIAAADFNSDGVTDLVSTDGSSVTLLLGTANP